MMQTMNFLGTFTGTSNKNGKPFYIAYFYGKEEHTKGFRSYNFFVEPELFNKLSVLTPLKEVKVDVRYINGSNVLVSVEA